MSKGGQLFFDVYSFDPRINGNTLEEWLASSPDTQHLRSYIWHREPLAFGAPAAAAAAAELSDCARLISSGSQFVGENVTDEWLSIHTLYRASARFPTLLVSLYDSDGQVLLIEGAMQLPDWLEGPDDCEHRVWVRAGQLHLIPPSYKVDSVADALQVMKPGREISASQEATVSLAVQSAIDGRLCDFPGSALEINSHLCSLELPIPCAVLLQHHPELVAAATAAYCDRELDDAPLLVSLKRFGGGPTVVVPVRFTRWLFAQLSHQKQRMPNSSKARDLGHKLACGFELLHGKRGMAAQLEAALREAGPFQAAAAAGEALPADDPEHWMSVSSREVDDLLRAQSGASGGAQEDAPAEGEVDEEKLQEAVEGMSHFMSSLSGLDGVEPEDEVEVEEEEEEKEKEKETAPEDLMKNFDVSLFLDAMQRGLGIELDGSVHEMMEQMDAELVKRGTISEEEPEAALVTNIVQGRLESGGVTGPMSTMLSVNKANHQ